MGKKAKKTDAPKKPKKRPVSVHILDSERSVWEVAMADDNMDELGPWVATVVRWYLKEKSCKTPKERDDQLLQIQQTVAEIRAVLKSSGN